MAKGESDSPRVASKVLEKTVLSVRAADAPAEVLWVQVEVHRCETNNALHYWLREGSEVWVCATQRIFEHFPRTVDSCRLSVSLVSAHS
jgi:hypothetical protein